ncbi:transmembrane amino acid transporter protein-domain-containing protein [Phycomyces nitens]|nr:transmembrane amino acid transporter protein-domain-containing protein [Phycomyces nitens]
MTLSSAPKPPPIDTSLSSLRPDPVIRQPACPQRQSSYLSAKSTPNPHPTHPPPRTSTPCASFFHSRQRHQFVRSVSSFSLYSHFAGEDFDSHQSRPSAVAEKRRSFIAEGSSAFSKPQDRIIDLGDTKDTKEDVPKASVTKAMFMFLKAFVGSGVLFLPKAFANGGLGLSIVLMVVIAVISLVGLLRLVEAQNIVGGSYGDMGGVLYGERVRYMVLFFIAVSQLGFVCSYLVFISGNLVNVVDVLSSCAAHLDQKYYIWIPLILVLPLALVRHIARLSFTAIIADVFILFGLVSVLYFASMELGVNGVGPNVKMVNPSSFALMIGTATFSFEGVGLVIPIVESMQKPERFPFVVTVGTMIVCVVYVLIGSISYLAYGDHIQAAVIYNFPPSNPLTITAQTFYSIAIILTTPLTLFPATKILENGLFWNRQSGSRDIRVKWLKNAFRLGLASLCALAAYSIGPANLDLFVSFVGSVFCVPLCFIFPGMFHYKISKGLQARLVDLGLIVWGAVILVYTLYVTIDSFIYPLAGSAGIVPFCL